MKQVQIIIDSTADVPERFAARCRVVPLTIHFGSETLVEGVSIDRRRFYERLIESDVLPTTSQATPAAFQTVFEEVTRAGQSAVVLTLSAELSGTYQSACIAAAEYENVYVIDSRSVAIGTGILVEYALSCVDAGMDAASIAARLEKKREDVCLIALLDTLEYLKRGGRVSKTVALAGGLLSIKPVVTVQDGEVRLIGKARGSRQGNNLLTEKIGQCGGVDFTLPILLGYSGLSDACLQKYVEDSRALWQERVDRLESMLICSVIGTHTGPGVVAVAFFKRSGS